MDVSIIIINYNTLQFTQNCINSVFEKTHGIEFEIILVDNASTDGSKEFFKKDKRIVFIENQTNLGFGKANNIGYKYATGRYIFLLNSDTLLLNNAIKYFYDWFEVTGRRDVACVGCLLLDYQRKPMHSYGEFPSIKSLTKTIISNYVPHRKLLNNGNTQLGHLIVDYITGADLFIRREVIEQCGFFDPSFFMYYEETDLQYRYNKKGYKSAIIYSPQIMHLHGTAKVNKSLRRMYIPLHSCILYCKKHFSLFYYISARLLLLLLIPKVLLYNDSISEKNRMLRLLFSTTK